MLMVVCLFVVGGSSWSMSWRSRTLEQPLPIQTLGHRKLSCRWGKTCHIYRNLIYGLKILKWFMYFIHLCCRRTQATKKTSMI